MKNANKSYNERFKENQEKLKKRAEDLLSNSPDEDEPQCTGNPEKIFEEDDTDKKKADID